MSAATDARPSDEDVQRYALEQLLEYLSPEEGRPEASAFLVDHLIGATLQIRDTFADQEAESLRRLWRRHAIDYAEMVADDLRLMWAERTVHQPGFYGL